MRVNLPKQAFAQKSMKKSGMASTTALRYTCVDTLALQFQAIENGLAV